MVSKLVLLGAVLIFNSRTSRSNPVKQNSKVRLNVCRQMESYFAGANNTHECWYNPDVDSQAHDIIKRYGYPFEAYKVTSKDNYITTLFRIPNGRKSVNGNRQPIFLLHGLATSAHIMVDAGRRSLAFALVDAGYDVWLGNLRGSKYSMGHTNLSYLDPEYWQFSFHEMGIYDLPVNLEFIANKTHKEIIFIGHSVSASIFHAFEDYHRELSKKILKVAVLVAPVVFLSNIQPIRKEFEEFNPIMVVAVLLGADDNSTETKSIMDMARATCNNKMPPIIGACKNGFYISYGLDSQNIPPYHIPLLTTHNPSGFSVNTLSHLLQMTSTDGTFQEFDYGVKRNMEKYDDMFPREYNIKECETPVMVFYGADDWMSTEEDIEKLLDTLPKEKVNGKYKIKASKWEHMDYFYGKKAPKFFYTPLIDKLKTFESGNFTTDNDDPRRKTEELGTTASEPLQPKPGSDTTEPVKPDFQPEGSTDEAIKAVAEQ